VQNDNAEKIKFHKEPAMTI